MQNTNEKNFIVNVVRVVSNLNITKHNEYYENELITIGCFNNLFNSNNMTQSNLNNIMSLGICSRTRKRLQKYLKNTQYNR